ncbi:MAG: nucleotidyl transferase AbiEii/AbiGii toxin family protein [Ruminococcus sp.]|nr:nucleotidyl transferase AbiEii/AbiGii toxin family protein [Ruminococcus sp.]
MALQRLAESELGDACVFKGGTSLSKCYPNSIERFSEDIDLTFYQTEGLSDKQIERKLKAVEKTMTEGFQTEPILVERNKRNKSTYFWYDDENNRVKLEIGSSVRPEPFSKKSLKIYIQEYLESQQLFDEISNFELVPVEINTLNIERTFIDKVMSVKRHAICGTLDKKVRHIYDVTRLFELDEIKRFLDNGDEVKRLLQLTKNTDSAYLEKRNIPKEYNPLGAYNFDAWRDRFDTRIKDIYEQLHKSLLYTNEKQDFNKAVSAFEKINQKFIESGE